MCTFVGSGVGGDTTPPTVTCPAATTVYIGSGSSTTPVQFSAATATDNSGGQVTITYRTSVGATVNPGSSFSVGRTTVTATATDPSGNQQQCDFDVTVNGTSLLCNKSFRHFIGRFTFVSYICYLIIELERQAMSVCRVYFPVCPG